jgi:hypothetical protein
MASSTVRAFTDPDVYHAAIRDTHAEAINTGRGAFTPSTRASGSMGLLFTMVMKACYHGDESLPRTTYSAFDPSVFAIASRESSLRSSREATHSLPLLVAGWLGGD